jgi:hypothetical protein
VGRVHVAETRPGGAEPVTYALKVEGTPYVVDASIYDDAVTIEELERLSSGQQ